MNGFFVGSWSHCLPHKTDKRIEIIINLCVGPLETYIVGIEDGKYFSENHIIEGLDAGAKYYKVLSDKEFNEELQREINICVNHGHPEQADLLREYLI